MPARTDEPGDAATGATHRFATLVIEHRRWVLLAILLSTVVFAIQIRKVEARFSPEDLFPQSRREQQVSKEFARTFGDADNTVLFLVRAPDVLAVEPVQYLHQAALHFRAQPFAAQVASVTLVPLLHGSPPRVAPVITGDVVTAAQARTLRAALADAPLVMGNLVGRRGGVAAVVIELRADSDRNRVVRALERYVSDQAPPPGVRVSLGGLPYMNATLIRKLAADQSVLLPGALLVCIIMLWLAFRWLTGVALATVTVAASTVLLVGAMATVGRPFDILNNIIPLLVIIIGLSDSIHLVNRYGEALGAGQDHREASRSALASMTFACFVTSATTAIGLGSLVAAGIPILSGFGIVATAGIGIAYVVTVTFLPAALASVRAPRRFDPASRSTWIEERIERSTRALLRRRTLVLVATGVFLLVCGVTVRNARVDDAVLDQFSPEEEAYQTMKLIERELDGVRPLEVSLVASTPGRFEDPHVANAIDRTTTWLARQRGVLRATSYTDHLHEAWYLTSGDRGNRARPFTSADQIRSLMTLFGFATPNPLDRFVDPSHTRARIAVRLADVGARENRRLGAALVAELERNLGEAAGTIEIALTGETIASARGLDALATGILYSLFWAVGLIFLFMIVLFRSLRLGLLSVPITLVPLLGTMAYMVARDIPLNTATVIIFSITIGLAVDGTIHMLVRFVEEQRAGVAREEALARAARGTGKANLVTCVTLAVGFSVLQLSAFVPVRRFGELIAITAVGCLVATLIVLPPLLHAGWRSKPENEARPRASQHASA